MNIKKVVLFFCLAVLPFASSLKAQIDSVKYLLQYNPQEDVFDMYLYIAGGKATSVLQRTATNTQISVLVPTGATFSIFKKYMPLQNNQNYAGTKPTEWSMGYSVIKPTIIPEYDIYSVVPLLSPSSQYNNLNTGDSIKIFSLKIKLKSGCFADVKLFDSSIAPPDSPAFNGADFSQGVTIGGTKPLFKGILPSLNPAVNQQSLSMGIHEEVTLMSSIPNSGEWAFWSADTGMELNHGTPGIATLKSTDLASGEYTLICQNDSITDVVCVSVQESSGNTDQFALSSPLVYPNPVFDVLNIQENDFDKMEIRDISGVVLWKSNQKANSIDISYWKPGLYVIHFIQGDQTRYAKFIKL